MKRYYCIEPGRTNYDGNLDPRKTNITKLPDNLTVGGSLDLSNTPITYLPDNLTVGRSLYLSRTKITALPDNLTVGGSLDLSNTQITALPDNLTVGGWLDLSGAKITALPDNLTVGGGLYLIETNVTALPENMTIGGKVHCDFKPKRTPKKLQSGDYIPGKYLYADGILTHVKTKKRVGKYDLYIGKIKGQNVVSDGTNCAHCRTLREGIADLNFKTAEDRGADQYKNLDLDQQRTIEELKTMYRVITGACQAGTEQFVSSIHGIKKNYSIREAIELTKGQYGAEAFDEFFLG